MTRCMLTHDTTANVCVGSSKVNRIDFFYSNLLACNQTQVHATRAAMPLIDSLLPSFNYIFKVFTQQDKASVFVFNNSMRSI